MSLRNSTNARDPADDTAALEQHAGVITRIVDFKFGFLSSEGHENIFFHFSELSDDAMAFAEPGCKATFYVKTNDWTADKKMKAVNVQIVSAPHENAFKNLQGVIQGDMRSRGFTFIDHKGADGTTTYLFHSTNLVNDAVSKAAGNTVKEGHKVIFDAEFNHKYNPPKPFATNVRIVEGQTELNAAAVALEFQSPQNSTWQRGSKLGLSGGLCPEAVDQLDADELTISPPVMTRNSSIADRISGLKSAGPARRWSRTTNTTGEKMSDKPSGGINIKETKCKFGAKCTRSDCWFEHPNGKHIDGTATLSAEEESNSGEDSTKAPVSSMGAASLRLLVQAIVKDTGKNSYLSVRNALQSQAYVGRALTRTEKSSVGDILEEGSSSTINTTNNNRESFSRASSSKTWSRGTGRASLTRGSFTGGRVSLSDMCRDPSLHSRMSAANTGTCA